jgi:hypothetical protein
MTVGSHFANAGPALDDDKKPTPTVDVTVAPGPAAPAKVEWGIDLRLRSVYIPQGLLQLFLDRAAGGTQAIGFGGDIVRRRGNLELALGFEIESLPPAEGVWINHGDTPNIAPGSNQAAVDYVLSSKNGSNFGWATIEFSFLNHFMFNKYMGLRYGAGAGLGIITGKVLRYNVFCAAGASPSSLDPQCIPSSSFSPYNGMAVSSMDSTKCGGQQPCAYNIPPVFPVVNAIIGFQFRPIDKLVLNVETGIRTIPFFGVSLGYFFL